MAKFTENSLLRHAKFICNRIVLFNNSTSTIDLINSPCMRTLTNLAAMCTNDSKMKSLEFKQKYLKNTEPFATQLVKNIFENNTLIKVILNFLN